MFSFGIYQKLGFKSLWKGIARTPESGAHEHQVGNPWSEGYYDVTRSGVTRCASWQTSGFFVEVNAGDGEYKSQSLFFEVQRNWTGLLVEPDPAPFSEMKTKNRKAFSINACVSLLPKCTNKTLAWVYYYIYTATLWFYKMHYGIITNRIYARAFHLTLLWCDFQSMLDCRVCFWNSFPWGPFRKFFDCVLSMFLLVNWLIRLSLRE